MKKFIMVSLFALVTMVLFSCSSSLKKEDGLYVKTSKIKDGYGKEQEIKIEIDPRIIDKKMYTEDDLERVIQSVSYLSMTSLKNQLSYEPLVSTEKSGFITIFGDTLHIQYNYIGQNGFGVKGKSNGLFEYTKNNLNTPLTSSFE